MLTRAILDLPAAPPPSGEAAQLLLTEADRSGRRVEYYLVRSAEHLQMAHKVRYAVFVVEQKFQEAGEVDEIDPACAHVVAYDAGQGEYVGTGRVYACKGGVWKLGRLAVVRDRRRQGVGLGLVRALEQTAKAAGGQRVELTAQLHARGFYAACGYAAVPGRGVHVEDGVDHVWLGKALE